MIVLLTISAFLCESPAYSEELCFTRVQPIITDHQTLTDVRDIMRSTVIKVPCYYKVNELFRLGPKNTCKDVPVTEYSKWTFLAWKK